MCAIYFAACPSIWNSLKYLKSFKSIAQPIYKKLNVLKQNERTGFSSILA